jgi:hypothetical protein
LCFITRHEKNKSGLLKGTFLPFLLQKSLRKRSLEEQDTDRRIKDLEKQSARVWTKCNWPGTGYRGRLLCPTVEAGNFLTS